MRTTTIGAALLAALTSSACVSLGTHEELAKLHSETKERLANAQLDLGARDKQLDAAKRKETDLQAALAAEQQRSADLDARRQGLEGELATAMAALRSTAGELAQVLKDKSALKGSVEEMKQALDELARRKAEADRRIAEYRSLLSRFQKLIDAGKLKVKIVDGRMVVQLSSDILFASGSAALSKDGKVSVVEVAGVLAQIPERAFQVEGHTDNVPIRTEQYPSNWELASARALTVVRAMTDSGLAANRVSAASYGDTKPSAANDTPEGKTQNRRIEIVVVPDLSSLPGFEELQKAGG
ncbi:MAG: OmpA family protein [Deltaproteobacteria bacterium]|nr:OmpA family protein [Deltaproteobacteria bacterium]